MSTLTGQDILVSCHPAARRARNAVGLDARNNTAAFVFLAPWIIGMVCLTLGPILASFYLSLTPLRHVHAARLRLDSTTT